METLPGDFVPKKYFFDNIFRAVEQIWGWDLRSMGMEVS
jgi:hypothetical protein